MKRVAAGFVLALLLSSCSDAPVDQIEVRVPPGVRVPPEMAYIPAGEFIMGDSGDPRTRGGEKVSLPAYFIDRFEVSRGQYAQSPGPGAPSAAGVVEAEKIEAGKEGFPATHVSFERAESYCARVGKRLPTEAEWEKAARGVDARKWPWKTYQQHPNTGFSGFIPEPVDKRKEWISPFGVYGMGHNVWEWTSDWYDYQDMPEKDKRRYRVLRGGLMQTHTVIEFSTVFFRNWMDPAAEYNFIGFRCARDVTESAR